MKGVWSVVLWPGCVLETSVPWTCLGARDQRLRHLLHPEQPGCRGGWSHGSAGQAQASSSIGCDPYTHPHRYPGGSSHSCADVCLDVPRGRGHTRRRGPYRAPTAPHLSGLCPCTPGRSPDKSCCSCTDRETEALKAEGLVLGHGVSGWLGRGLQLLLPNPGSGREAGGSFGGSSPEAPGGFLFCGIRLASKWETPG